MNLITFDAETYYDREFSLSKISTEEYIRDSRFQMIGAAIKINDGKTRWYPAPELQAALDAIDWSDAMLLAQNTQFDGAILSWRYGIKPKALADTMGMSRALFPHEKSHSLKAQAERAGVGVKGDEVIAALGKRLEHFTPEELHRYGLYCINDVELTFELFRRYVGMDFPMVEMRLIDLTLRMYTEPVLRLDADLLVSHLTEVRTQKARVVDDLALALDLPDEEALRKELMSNEKFAQLLRNMGVEPPMKTSLTTGKEAYAFSKTDEEFTALQEHPDTRVQALVAARLGVKTTLEETRTERFIGIASRGSFPVPLKYYGAHSGRWGGSDSINLQNLPSRDPSKRTLKNAILPPEGYVFIDCDSSQIEARTLAWLAGQNDLLENFRAKKDVYREMAAKIYAVPPDKVTPTQRQVGKTVVLGCGYGVGHTKLQGFLKIGAKVEVTLEEAKRIIDTYRDAVPNIVELWKRADRGLKYLASNQEMPVDVHGIVQVTKAGLTLPSGLLIQYPNLKQAADAETGKAEWTYQSRGSPVRIYGAKCVENFTQAVARCIVAEQMLRIAKRYKVVMTVHDSIGCVAPKEEQEEAVAYVEACMRWNPKWATGLPLACESGVGDSYGAC